MGRVGPDILMHLATADVIFVELGDAPYGKVQED